MLICPALLLDHGHSLADPPVFADTIHLSSKCLILRDDLGELLDERVDSVPLEVLMVQPRSLEHKGESPEEIGLLGVVGERLLKYLLEDKDFRREDLLAHRQSSLRTFL